MRASARIEAMKLEAVALSRTELRRYSRPLLLPEWATAQAQEKLKQAKVLVVGAGGLGGPIIQQLAGAGLGALWIADGDTVDLSNLHRQMVYTTADIGRPKAQAAAGQAQAINPFVNIQTFSALNEAMILDLLPKVDLIIDATDNFESRYAIADVCMSLKRQWVWGAASGTTGMLSVFGPDLGLRAIFPEGDESQSCDEVGVLGPVPQIIGSLMSLEVLKVLTGVGNPLRGRLLIFDGLENTFKNLKLQP